MACLGALWLHAGLVGHAQDESPEQHAPAPFRLQFPLRPGSLLPGIVPIGSNPAAAAPSVPRSAPDSPLQAALKGFARALVPPQSPANLTNTLPVLTQVRQVLDLGLDGARTRPHPVRLLGILTYPPPRATSLYLDDGTGGIQVIYTYTDTLTNRQAGQLIWVDGIAGAGPLRPWVAEARIHTLGQLQLPPPHHPPASDLAAGLWHGEQVELEGEVRDLQRSGQINLLLARDGHHFEVEMPQPGPRLGPLPLYLHDARVRVRGVAVSEVDTRGRPTTTRIQVNQGRHLRVIRRAPTNLFDRPLVSAASLRGRTNGSDELVRVLGVVLHHFPDRRLFLQDETGALQSEPLEGLPRRGSRLSVLERPPQDLLEPGQSVELVGAPAATGGAGLLRDAQYRVREVPSGAKPALPPTPLPTTVAEAAAGRHDARLITVRGRLVGRETRLVDRLRYEVFQVQEGDQLFEAVAEQAADGHLRELPKQAILSLTGICSLASEVGQIRTFRLWLRRPDDLRILGTAAPWELIRPGRILAVSGTLGCLAMTWILLLRRQVAQRRRAEEKARQSEASTRTLNGFATALLQERDEARILHDLARHVVTELGFDGSSIYLREPDPGSPTCRVSQGANPGRTEPSIEHLTAQALATGQLHRTLPGPAAGSSAALAVPFDSPDGILGVLVVQQAQPGGITPEHEEILQALASLVSNRLIRLRAEGRLRELNLDLEQRIDARTGELLRANEQLFHEISERTRAEKVQKALFEISEAVHASADLPSLYARIHASIGVLMPARNFYLALFDDVTGLVTFPYHRDQSDPTPLPRRNGRGMTEYVLRTGKPTLANLAEIERLKAAGEYRQSGSPAAIWLGVPLTVAGRSLGVMAVQDHHEALAFDEEDKRLLTFVAGQAALAIERKRREEELRRSTRHLQESEERFGKAFRSLPAILSIQRVADQLLLEVNEAFLVASGFAREEVLGRTTQELGLWADPTEHTEFLARAQRQGFVHAFEARLLTKSRVEEVALLSAETVVLNSESCLLVLCIVVTERKRAERELVRALAHERELSELKGRFVALVSHEFRTPLGIITSSAELLESYFDRLPPAERRANLQDITDATRHMSHLMEEVLLLGRAEAGKLACRPAPVDFATLCQTLVDEVLSATQQRCPVVLHLPPASRLAGAEADEGLLRHLLTNLLGNAVKYSPASQPVALRVRVRGREVSLAIHDRGLGIPAADQPLLFEAFHRGRNVGLIQGSGLGLSIVRRCVDLQGGRIRFRSREGRGTTFVVTLPLLPPLPVPPLEPTPSSLPSPT